MLENVNIVLVNPSHPGNIGSGARAMKTMGLMNLSLVAPREYPSEVATALAAGARDILEGARIFSDLETAITDCHYVIGSSARVRGIGPVLINVKDAVLEIYKRTCWDKNNKVAILFGRENSGLTNQELKYCQAQMYIPTSQEFSSLNLAAAVQIVCYELRCLHNKEDQSPIDLEKKEKNDKISKYDMELYYDHLYTTLLNIGFLERGRHEKIMAKLRILYDRSCLSSNELAILRGILSEVQTNINKP